MVAIIPEIRRDNDTDMVKLERIYITDHEKYSEFRPILQDEIERNLTREKNSATNSLLWLKRALQFIACLLDQIVKDEAKEEPSESIVPFCLVAYENALKRYHGWMIQKVFQVLIKVAPRKKDLLRTLANGEECTDSQVVADMEPYVSLLNANINSVHNLLASMNLNFDDRV
ncbi:hypothetical protein CAPTEDRAFT_199242 [Capitella teleta]|uniref:Glycolipid transfer protein domain-containing protein n=1 Tax=Capitella teleta TaxID=283909 RepID=R7TCX1_CAPTE|nr:hypothetical protein CAPTEDRAFT_199242 [Capitella teleta]|eukprot:ELT88921.1 hypothetical protein CAPTEDRAFT_199242 [Capitella teleta]